MAKQTAFYDTYHKKNDTYVKVIGRGNFTYFYILRFLHFHCINRFTRDWKVLDIGCGVGTMSLYLAQFGLQVTGIDISKRAIAICKHAQKQLKLKNVHFIEGEIQKATGKYDLVLCMEVIEHIQDDKAFLKKIGTHLKKGGMLFLTTPSLDNMLYRTGFYTKFDKEVGHVRRYTLESIRSLVSANGFRVVHTAAVESPLRNLLFTTKLGFVIRFIKGPLVPIFHWVDMMLVPLFGASDLMIVAEKK